MKFTRQGNRQPVKARQSVMSIKVGQGLKNEPVFALAPLNYSVIALIPPVRPLGHPSRFSLVLNGRGDVPRSRTAFNLSRVHLSCCCLERKTVATDPYLLLFSVGFNIVFYAFKSLFWVNVQNFSELLTDEFFSFSFFCLRCSIVC